MSFILPSIINFKSSIKNRLIILGIFSSISSNTSLIYIRKRIEDIKKSYGMLILINISGLIYPFIINLIFLFIVKDWV